jgi:hypothetical protein
MRAFLAAAVASMIVQASCLAADDGGGSQREMTALSQLGGHRLRLKSVEQIKSPWDEKICALTLDFELEHALADGQFASQAPENVFIEKVGPLKEVLLTSGANVATNKHSAYCTRNSAVVISTLEIGKEQKQLQRFSLGLTLVKVTEWQQLEFKGLKEGKNDTLHCGPFEIHCTGNERSFDAGAGASTEFDVEHEKFRKQMPLSFLHHYYAIEHSRLTDALNRPLDTMVGNIQGGSTSARFSISKVLDFDNVLELKADDRAKPQAVVKMEAEPIAYPVTLQLKLPKKYETELVIFEFGKLDLPSVKK